jgi:serine/threonine protein kinase
VTLSTGSRVGSYEVESLLGAGGMGEVYKARDTRLQRSVAIKILPSTFNSDPERLARFEREAQVLASLNHANIAQIYGVEETAGALALVMELVDGPTLAEIIARRGAHRGSGASRSGAWDVDPLSIARQLADALEAAHDQGIVHRDLKPQNIILRSDGTVKVLDFGLAKALDPVSGIENPANSPTITNAATRVGTLLRHGGVHGARAGQGPPGRSARGHLGLRRGALRALDRFDGLRG